MSRQTVALLPLCFCTCNQDLFCPKTCLVTFLKPFPLFKLKSVLYSYKVRQTGFPMFVVHSGLWMIEEAQRLPVIKMKILTVTLFWLFKACVMCKIFLKSLYIFKVSQGRKWNFKSERFWSRVIQANCRKWKQVIHYWRPWKNISLDKKSLYRFRLKAVIFILNPVLVDKISWFTLLLHCEW